MTTKTAVMNALEMPESEQPELAALYRRAVAPGSEARLVGPGGEAQTLPEPVYRLLVRILKDLSEGSAVAVVQDRRGLTTAQASRYLGVSRQFFVNLIEAGEMPFHKVGTHRRVALRDVVAYEKARAVKRRTALAAMVREAVEDGSYDIVPGDEFTGE